MELANEIREVLKGFYQTIKGMDKYLRFVFITGISKFAKVSLFSGLNQLNDISLNKEYGDICGYTEEELLKVFGELIKSDKELEEIREWYNGYWWLGSKIYNPLIKGSPYPLMFYCIYKIGKLKFIGLKQVILGKGAPSPEFLVKLIRENNYYIPLIEEIVLRKEMLDWFDVEDIMIEVLMYQTGYLTIKKVEQKGDIKEVVLSYPNKEVRTALNLYISRKIEKGSYRWIKEIREIFERREIEKIEELMNKVLLSIPYVWYKDTSRYESFYCALFYVLLVSSGLEVIAEDVTSIGRIDLTVISKGKVYIIELKVDKEGAIEQIKEKRYYEKYLDREEIYLVGIVIDSKERKVEKMDIERYR